MTPRGPARTGLFACLILAGAAPCRAQTVIPPDTTPSPSAPASPRPGTQSVRGPGDTAGARTASPGAAAAPAAAAAPGVPGAPAPAPPPPPPPPPPPAPVPALPRGVCTDPAGGPSTDVLYVTFRARSRPAEREAALKPLHGTIVAPDPDDPASAYVRVPSDGNEFALRAIADRLIRVPVVKEVGPVPCPATQ
jgi:hypothetical protein